MKNFIEDLNEKIHDANESLKDLKKALTQTNKFLRSCEENGIKTVSIGKETKKIKSTQGWPFSHENSVFADERGKHWPAIWKVVEEVGLSGGCGNAGQHGLTGEAMLIDGVYTIKNGKWYRE